MELTAHLTSTHFNWRTLLRWAAIADLIVLLGMAVILRDVLALALATIIITGLALVARRARVGFVVLAFISAVITFYTFTGAINNIQFGEPLQDLILPAYLACASATLLLSAIMAGLNRDNPDAGARSAIMVASSAVVLFIALVGIGALTGDAASQALPASDIALATENMAFSTSELTVEAGKVTLLLANHDLFWHTFTIDALGVDVKAPIGGERVITFKAEPGTYTFYCAIPGHETIGMRGTLIVRAPGEQ
jgi:plastocyanin